MLAAFRTLSVTVWQRQICLGNLSTGAGAFGSFRGSGPNDEMTDRFSKRFATIQQMLAEESDTIAGRIGVIGTFVEAAVNYLNPLPKLGDLACGYGNWHYTTLMNKRVPIVFAQHLTLKAPREKNRSEYFIVYGD